MTENLISKSLSEAISGRQLLEHPFYVRWEAGELSEGELGAYAEQYRFIERSLPEALRMIVDGLEGGEARELAAANLADELGNPMPHVELFESFASAVEARSDAPELDGARRVVDCYLGAANPVATLATIAAYELQAQAIATTKSDGLRRHYGIDEDGTSFWDVHSTIEADHAQWSTDALVALGADPADVFEAARASADAWWAFLDERGCYLRVVGRAQFGRSRL